MKITPAGLTTFRDRTEFVNIHYMKKPHSKQPSLIEYVLMSFLPFTNQNIRRTGPKKFFDELASISKANRRSLSATISRAKTQGYLKEVELNHFKLTNKGLLKIQRHLVNQHHWDKNWRVVFFDIPERFKKKRDYFTSELRALGFKPWQRSVWICPYDRTKEVDLLAEELGLWPYVEYLIVKSVTSGEKLRKLFNLG